MKQEIMDLPMQALFCQQIMADDLDVWKGHVVATVQECTECYYGAMLLQDIIVHEFSFEEIQDWMANELGYNLQDFQTMLDFYSLKPEPDPIHDEAEYIKEFCDDDYDYWLECSQDAMWITKNS